MNNRHAFTLMEIIIAVVLVSILAGIAVPTFMKAQERAADREARTNLKLIQTAEETHRLEDGSYIACANTDACNTALNLDLPDAGGNWNYVVDVGVNNFTAQANREDESVSDNDWMIEKGDEEASEQ